MSLEGQCPCMATRGLSHLPKPVPGSPKRLCCFCGSFIFSFSQGRGQAGLQHLAAGLALKSKPAERPAFAALVLLRGWATRGGARTAEAPAQPCPCSASSKAPVSLPGQGDAVWSPFRGFCRLPALPKERGHITRNWAFQGGMEQRVPQCSQLTPWHARPPQPREQQQPPKIPETSRTRLFLLMQSHVYPFPPSSSLPHLILRLHLGLI